MRESILTYKETRRGNEERKMDNQNNYQMPANSYGTDNQNGGSWQNQGNWKKLPANRDWALFIILGILTCGIYWIVELTMMGNELNVTASPRDGKHTMNYCLATFVFGILTCGIFQLVWYHMFSERVGEEARLRGVDTKFGAATFWLWYILGSFIIVGPYIYMCKLCDAMNGINESYNRCGR